MDERQATRLLGEVGQALTDGDAQRVARCFAPPGLVLVDDGAKPLADANSIARFFAGAIDAYRAQGITATRPELERFEPLSERLAAVDVRWPGLDAAGAEKASERSHYLLWLADDGRPRIRVALTTPG